MKSRQNTYRILGRDKSRLTFVVQRFRSGGFDCTETARDTVVLFGAQVRRCRSLRMTTAELRRTNRARQQSASEGRFLKGYREEPLLREGGHHGCYATRFREGFGDCRGDGGGGRQSGGMRQQVRCGTAGRGRYTNAYCSVSFLRVVLDHFGYWDFSYNLSCLNSRRKRRSSYGHQG